MHLILTLKAPNTTIAEFANTVDPDKMAHYERLQFQHNTALTDFFFFCRAILSPAFWRFKVLVVP